LPRFFFACFARPFASVCIGKSAKRATVKPCFQQVSASQNLTTMANIFLIGPMGAGKTTVGRQLARRLDRPQSKISFWQPVVVQYCAKKTASILKVVAWLYFLM